jgi:PAS domain S-box
VNEAGRRKIRDPRGTPFPEKRLAASSDGKTKRLAALLSLGYLVLAAAILYVGRASYLLYLKKLEIKVQDELVSIADLKTEQLARWRAERLADAFFLDENVFISVLAGRVLKTPDDDRSRRQLAAWVEKFEASGIYDRIQLLDREGAAFLSVPAGLPGVSAAVKRRLPDIFFSGKPEIVDFFMDESEGRPFLSLLIPIFKNGIRPDVESVLALRLDPRMYLYPYLARRSSSSRTAETHLVRRDGDDAVFLDEDRFRQNNPFPVRIPLRDNTIFGQAVEGREGLIRGIDDRRNPVIACLRRVPGSPWFLVAQIDTDELYAPARKRFLGQMAVIISILTAVGLAAAMIPRRQKMRFLRERLAAARSLHELSSRQEALIASLPEIIIEIDPAKVCFWANMPGLDFFGEDVIGKNIGRYYASDEDLQTKMSPLFEGSGEAVHIEGRHRRRDGEIRLLGWWCRGIKDPEGRVTAVLCSGRDITEERRDAEDRRESEARYRTLVDNAPAAVFVVREDRVVLVNAACTRLFGAAAPDLLLDRSPYDLIHPDHREAFRERIRRLRDAGEVFPTLEKKIVRLDGSTRDVEVTAVPFPDRGVMAVHVVLSDITERKRVEAERETALAAVKENQSIFDQFMKNSPVYMFFKDENIRALSLSANYSIMLGMPVTAALGKTMSELFPSDLARNMVADDQRILREGRTITVDEELNGRHYTTIKFPIHIEGKPRYLAGFTLDITERKLAEDRIKAANEALLVSLREKELLLQEVHHRVKNNMQIISSLFNLESEHASSETREILKRGQARIRSMSLIHEKLYRSVDLSKIDLSGYLESLSTHLFQIYVVDPRQIRLETDIAEVRLDINSAIPFGLIINELISNALKHAFPGGRKGVIQIRLARAAGDTVILQVSDDGVGLPEGFDRSNSAGFGFQIINLLVEQLDAVLDVDRNDGTTFTLKFKELRYPSRP